MASRFWIGGTGTWDGSTTTHWAATTGGSGGASVPGSADTVTFDGNSGGGTVTVNTNFNVISLTMGAFTGTLDFSANNNSVTLQTVNLSGTGTRTLNMGSGTWTVTGSGVTIWTLSTTTGMTLNAGASTLQFTYSGGTGTRTCIFGGGGFTYNIVNFTAGSDTVSLTQSLVCNQFSSAGFTGIWNKAAQNFQINGSLTLGTGSTFTSTGGTLTISGTGNVTMNGVNTNIAITINAPSDIVTLIGNLDMTGTVAATLTITAGDFEANGNNVSTPIFVGSGSSTRTITLGSGIWTITGNSATVWNMTTITGLTFSGASATINFTYSGSTGTRTLVPSSSLTYGTINISAGSDIVSQTSSLLATNFSTTGFTGNYSKTSQSFTLSGNFTLGTGSTFTSTGGSLTLTSTSSSTINTNGISLSVFSIVTTGVGGTFTLGSNITQTGSASFMVTNGSFNTGNFTMNIMSFSSSNSNTRAITLGTSTLNIDGNWNLSTITGLTFSGASSTINLSNTNLSFTGGGFTYGTVTVSGGGASVIGSTANIFATFTYTGVGAGDSLTFNQNNTVNGTMTITGNSGANTVNVKSGTVGTLKVLTFASASFTNCTWTDISLTQSGSNTGNWVLNEVLNLTSATVFPVITINQGVFSTNNFNITAGAFNSGNSLTRTVTMGSSLFSLYGQVTPFVFTTTGITLSAGTSTVEFTDTSNSNITITFGANIFYNFYFHRGTSTGNITLNGNPSLNQLEDDGTATHSIIFTAGQNFTITGVNGWQVSGTPGNLITLTSTTTATFGLINASGGNFNADYLNIQHSVATPVISGVLWYAGIHSINNQSVTSPGSGWIFNSVSGAAGDFLPLL